MGFQYNNEWVLVFNVIPSEDYLSVNYERGLLYVGEQVLSILEGLDTD